MKWLSSSGGPLILLGKVFLSKWGGIDNDDFDRACSISDYIGVINVGKSNALILGDEPSQTLIHKSYHLGIILVRWQWAESEKSVQNYLESLTSEVFKDPIELIEFNVDESELLLFDSAIPGNDATGLSLNISKAEYTVSTIHYEPDNDTSLILNQLLLKPN